MICEELAIIGNNSAVRIINAAMGMPIDCHGILIFKDRPSPSCFMYLSYMDSGSFGV